MPSLTRLRPQPDNRLAFLGGFLRKPREVGSIIPSSRFLERRLVKSAGIAHARVVVELGPGTGGTTRALLRAMRPDARLFSIEINPRFASLLRRFGDPRLFVHTGDAADVRAVLERYGADGADAVLSGIPFSTMPRAVGLEILSSVREALRPSGVFVAYQVRDRVEHLGREVFGPAQVQTELRNIPPMRVYRWGRGADA
jgi:phosphatidylethanolamine/phosphatidyl-N-methylethanolamine N-methyltransferase